MADVVVSQSSIHGTGVFAIRDFSTGEIVLTIDDSRVVDDDHPLDGRRGEYAVHCDYLASGRVVLMAVPERFINSSCNPNTYVRTLEGSRRVIASRSIRAGDEVTYDYILNNHGGDIWECRCGTAQCRRIMPSSFFDLPNEEQRRLRPFLDAWFVHEHRPRLERLDAADILDDE